MPNQLSEQLEASMKRLRGFEAMGKELGLKLDDKQRFYGDSFLKGAEFLQLLFGAKIEQKDYVHLGILIRMFDKMNRLASPNRNDDDEDPWDDLAGYAMLGKSYQQKVRAAQKKGDS